MSNPLYSFYASHSLAMVSFYEPAYVGLSSNIPTQHEYPKGVRICVKARYARCEVHFGSYIPRCSGTIHVLSITGGTIDFLRDNNVLASVAVERLNRSTLYYSEGSYTEIELCSRPLSLEELYEIAERLRGDELVIRWGFEGYGMLEPSHLASILNRIQASIAPLPVVQLKASSGQAVIEYATFVKRVLEPADKLKRVFVELAVEAVDEQLINRIRDPQVREALRALLEKQKLLLEALEEYYRAVTTADRRDIIDRVRRAIERLTMNTQLGRQIFNLSKKALTTLGIIKKLEPEYNLEGVLTNVIDKGLVELSNALFRLASNLGVHAHGYRPDPESHEVELILYTTIVFLNYLTSLLFRYGLHT